MRVRARRGRYYLGRRANLRYCWRKIGALGGVGVGREGRGLEGTRDLRDWFNNCISRCDRYFTRPLIGRIIMAMVGASLAFGAFERASEHLMHLHFIL